MSSRKKDVNVRAIILAQGHITHRSTFMKATPLKRAIGLAFVDLRMLNPGIKLKGWKFKEYESA